MDSKKNFILLCMKAFIPFAAACVLAWSQTAPAGGVATGTTTGQVPLDELSGGTYLGATGGLYPGGSNVIPATHFAAGQALAQQLQPLDTNGNPSPSGKIGVVCLGMSNSSFIFSSMIELLVGQTASNVVIVQAAKGGYDLGKWQDPANVIWPTAVAAVNAAGITPAQVQVVLQTHSMANSLNPPKAWPMTPQDVQAFSEDTMRNLHLPANFPNAKLCFWSSREYAGHSTTMNNPEPYAYQSGFAVKWMIEKQISGDPTLNFDPAVGPVQCPWMAWGPYVWGDGLTPRANGMFWEIRDFNADGVHPSIRGRTKAGAAWARFLLTNPLTAPWLRAAGNRPPMVKVIGPTTNLIVEAGGRVAIEAHAEDIDGTISRVDFMQGNTVIGSDTTAPYSFLWTGFAAGDYPVKAVAYDDLGAGTTSFPVTLLLRDPAAGNGSGTVASDNFESSDYVGGAGWEQQGWTLAGSPVVTTVLSPPEGIYQAQLHAGDSITRSADLTGIPTPSLVFKWRGQVPAGYTFVVENIGPSTQTLLTRTGLNVSTAVTETVPLSALNPGAGFAIRFRVTGPANAANLLLDDIRITTPVTATPAAPTLALRPTSATGFQLIGSAAIHQTYTVEFSGNLAAWTPLYHTTAIEDGTYTIPETVGGASGFFRTTAVNARKLLFG
jgi:hypothetical protein